MRDKDLMALACKVGFDHAGIICADILEFMPEVREMCAADKCRSYDRNWSCPPGCGTLEELEQRAKGYIRGILLQSTGDLEDDFDFESMAATEKRHKNQFFAFVRQIQDEFPGCFPMGSGACTLCPVCTYPDAPCRHPELVYPSMEACGLMVSQVCRDGGIGYYYGRGTITYTAMVLLD